MKKTTLLLILVIIAGFFIFAYKNPYDFNLQSELKKETTLKDFKGKKLIVYFGYTFCPDICPATLALIGKELKTINNNKAHLLFISLDPARDNNLSKTNEWLRYFYPNADALIAKNENVLQKITKNYGVQYQKIDLKDSLMHYSIAHSNQIFLFNEEGELKKIINDLNPKEVDRELKDFLDFK